MTSLVEDTVVTHTDKATLLELRDLTVDYGYGATRAKTQRQRFGFLQPFQFGSA
jgi:hypothetical protein